MSTHRCLRYEHGAFEQLEKLTIDVRRYDELMEAIDATLCVAPEAFPVIPKTTISFCRTNEFVGTSFSGLPSLAIYFHYDAACVYIISIEQSAEESYGF